MRRALDLIVIIVALPLTAIALIAYAANIDLDEYAGWRQ